VTAASIITEPLPVVRGGFRGVIADPPWQYSAGQATRIKPRYPTLTVDQLAALPVRSLVADQALMACWVTSSFLEEGLRLLPAWGFQYKTTAVWVKGTGSLVLGSTEVAELFAEASTLVDSAKKFAAALRAVVQAHAKLTLQIGMGSYVRSAHELVLIGSRGGLTAHEAARDVPSVFVAPRGEHSVKPQALHQAMERLVPGGPYLELFARRRRRGWVTWGNDQEVASGVA
jgi:N6-adenosine-specific RNA methylase IME4